jgi:CheY-like chemotaxis protein
MESYEDIIKSINILLVDDDQDYLQVTHSYLTFQGYSVDMVTSGQEALKTFSEKIYHIVLIDYFMPGMSGEEVINEIRKTNKEVIIILQTGFSGQKPPIESMQKLNIQNYHDKTEGIDKLNLELISAVKIFMQQNEIALSKYKSTAIGKLIASIAEEIRSSLMSVGAGIELTNMLIKDTKSGIEIEKLMKINKYYDNNKIYLEKTDKVLTAIVNQLAVENSEDILKDDEVIELVGLILQGELKLKGIIFDKKIALKSDSYLKGNINDAIFITCEIIRKIIEISDHGTKIEFVLTDDDNSWIFIVRSENISKVDFGLLKNVVLAIKNLKIQLDQGEVQILIQK